jgi:hypothetical protein
MPANSNLARLAGFEPAAYGLEVRSSIHLSYRRNVNEKSKTNYLSMVGASRFELPTSCSQGRRAKPGCATPRPSCPEVPRFNKTLTACINPCLENATKALFYCLNCRSGRLTDSPACQESLVIPRDGILLPQGRRANQAALRPDLDVEKCHNLTKA